MLLAIRKSATIASIAMRRLALARVRFSFLFCFCFSSVFVLSFSGFSFVNCVLNRSLEALCGDGYLIQGVEECDDGNTNDGDGCTSNCTLEPSWVCNAPNTSCIRMIFLLRYFETMILCFLH
jgi:cysteine-rich repeat protein